MKDEDCPVFRDGVGQAGQLLDEEIGIGPRIVSGKVREDVNAEIIAEKKLEKLSTALERMALEGEDVNAKIITEEEVEKLIAGLEGIALEGMATGRAAEDS